MNVLFRFWHNKNIIILSTVILVFNTCIQTVHEKQVRFQGRAQGTYYEITYFDKQGRNFQRQMDSILDAFNLSLSVYEPNSIISRFNRDEPDVEPDNWFITVFNKAREVAEATGGNFDYSVGPLVNAWGFGYTDRLKVSPDVIDSLLKFVGFQNFEIKENRLIKKIPGSQIDFNAIAKGYAVDVLGEFLEQEGIRVYLIDIGGEVLARGRKPDGSAWRIGIEKPTEDALSARELKSVIRLENMAIATSGNYRRFYEQDGIRYSHTIDPLTGYPVQHTLLSASVLAADCMTADAYATAFMVMGVDATIEFLNSRPQLEAFLIYSAENGEIKTWGSHGFEKLLEMAY
jgi:FAD:protein FMN transferase